MIWIIVGYMWLFLHRPFEVWPILGTIRLERVYMILTLAAWLGLADKQLTENKINIAIGLFAFAMFTATVMSPFTNPIDSVVMQNWFKYVVFYVLIMTSVKKESDLKILVTGMTVCFFIYMLHSYREYLCGHYVSAMGTKRMVGVDSTMADPNTYGGSIVIMLAFLLPLFCLVRKKWHYAFLLAYFLLSLRCVQLTGSRSSLIVLLAMFFTVALCSKHRFTFIPILLVGAVIGWFTLTDNLKQRYLTLFDPTINESANQSTQGRIDGFWDGLALFQSSPIWGYGPNMHGQATGKDLLSHCLYGQIPGELGGIGILAFLTLLACYAINHIQIWLAYNDLKKLGYEKEGLYCFRVSTAIMIGIALLLCFGAGAHNGYRFNWVWFAGFQALSCKIITDKVIVYRHQALRSGVPSGVPPGGPLPGVKIPPTRRFA